MYDLISKTDDFVVVSKWSGISVHKDTGEQSLTMGLAKDLGLDQIYLVHRLDKATSGLMVFALTREVAAALGKRFSERQVSKFYWAISDKKPNKKQGLIVGDMTKGRRGSWRLAKETNNPAITQFFSYSLGAGLRLFVLKPTTGKTHQLRVALKSLAAPIAGDQRYGDLQQAVQHSRCYLHAYLLSFEWLGEQLTFKALPKFAHQTTPDLFDHLTDALVSETGAAESVKPLIQLDADTMHGILSPDCLSWPILPKRLQQT